MNVIRSTYTRGEGSSRAYERRGAIRCVRRSPLFSLPAAKRRDRFFLLYTNYTIIQVRIDTHDALHRATRTRGDEIMAGESMLGLLLQTERLGLGGIFEPYPASLGHGVTQRVVLQK